MNEMNFVAYVYANKNPLKDLKTFRCPNCGRIIFRHNSSQILLSNAYGASIKDLPPNSNFIDHMCHSCKAYYQILFQ